MIDVASMYGMVAPDSRIYSSPRQASPFHYGPAKAAPIQLTRAGGNRGAGAVSGFPCFQLHDRGRAHTRLRLDGVVSYKGDGR